MTDEPFAKFWNEYATNLRADLSAEMKEGIRVVAYFAFMAGAAHERGKAAPPKGDPRQDVAAINAVIRSFMET